MVPIFDLRSRAVKNDIHLRTINYIVQMGDSCYAFTYYTHKKKLFTPLSG